MLDLIVRNAVLPDGQEPVDIAIQAGKIVEIRPSLAGNAREEIDAAGNLAMAPFIDCHFHMDATLSYGNPRVNQSGTLLEGIQLWGELKPDLTVEAIKARASRYCRMAIARGTLSIRSHVDICDDRLLAVQALLEVREELKEWLDLQLVAFPQDGFLRDPKAKENLLRALEMGVDIVGGIPHFERTMAAGTESVRQLCEIAEARGLLVDMHCDETDDPHSRHVESLAFETQRLGLHGRVAGSHLTSMHSMDNYYVSKLIPLMAASDLHVIANPLINIVIQGRHDTFPKRRGLTRVKELMAAGLNVAFGQDCMMDPWYSFGSSDMLEVAQMGLHVAQMTSVAETRACFDAVTIHPAKVMHLDDYGLAVGKRGDLVILQCSSPFDALRLRPARLFVIKRGKVIAKTPFVQPELFLGKCDEKVDFNP